MAEQFVNSKETPAAITEDGRVLGEAIACDMDLAVSLEHAMSFTLHDDAVTPTGAGDYFSKLQNTSAYQMVITGLRGRCTAGDVIQMMVSAGYVSATTHGELEPVNRMVGSTILASAFGQFESDVDITGQPAAIYEVRRLTLAAAADGGVDLTACPIVLLPNQALSLCAVTGTSPISYSVDFYFAVIPTVNG